MHLSIEVDIFIVILSLAAFTNTREEPFLYGEEEQRHFTDSKEEIMTI